MALDGSQPSAPAVQLSPAERLVVALDYASVGEARALVAGLGDAVRVYKIGLELAMNGGLQLACDLSRHGRRVFLDMKLHDIGNTVEKAVANVARQGFDFLTVHATDRKTLEAAVRGRDLGDARPAGRRLNLLAVTVLTNCDADDLKDQGVAEDAGTLAVRRARMAQASGFDGVIASGHEAAAIRAATSPSFIIKVPGIRPAGSAVGDQSRIMTPALAIAAGATYLVVGRPITAAADPLAATQKIVAEIASAC